MVKIKMIKASTLIEAIVAMVIITISLGFSFSIISDISRTYGPQLKLRAVTEGQNMIKEINGTSYIEDEDRDMEGLHIERRVYVYRLCNDLQVVEVTIYDKDGMILSENKKLIEVPE